jgi:hypothetical protein
LVFCLRTSPPRCTSTTPGALEAQLRPLFLKAAARNIPVLDGKFLSHCVVASHVVGAEKQYFGCRLDL